MARRLYRLEVNGLEQDAFFSDASIEGAFLPLLQLLTRMAEAREGRVAAFVAGPPGVGKSTLCLMLERLSRERDGLAPVRALGLDGFHFPNAYLDAHAVERGGREVPLRSVKGAPESFDAASFAVACARLRETDGGIVGWPLYSRRLHDPVPDAVRVEERVVLVEGNWLLLDEPVWAKARAFADLTLMVAADEGMLRERLVGRKVAGGSTREEAQAWYERTDGPNVRRVLNDSVPADVTWQMDAGGDYLPV